MVWIESRGCKSSLYDGDSTFRLTFFHEKCSRFANLSLFEEMLQNHRKERVLTENILAFVHHIFFPTQIHRLRILRELNSFLNRVLIQGETDKTTSKYTIDIMYYLFPYCIIWLHGLFLRGLESQNLIWNFVKSAPRVLVYSQMACVLDIINICRSVVHNIVGIHFIAILIPFMILDGF